MHISYPSQHFHSQTFPSPLHHFKKERKKNMWDDLPLDLLSQIFSYLPLDSLARAMSTCKHWHTCAISRPPRPGRRHPPWFLSMHVRSPARSCRAYNPAVDRWLSIPLDFAARPVRFIGSVGDGLILCKFGPGPLSRLGLCNPFTRQFDELPDLVCSRRNPAFAVVMGADEKLEVYVAGGTPEPNSPRMGQVLIEPTVEMYSQRAGGWRVIGSIPGHFATLLTVWTFGEGVHVGGTVYWVTSARAYTVVAYEIGPRAWREVKVPETERLLWAGLFCRAGGLGLAGGTSEGGLSVWELGAGDEWSMIDAAPPEMMGGFRSVNRGGDGDIRCAATRGGGGGVDLYMYSSLGCGIIVRRELPDKKSGEWFLIDGVKMCPKVLPMKGVLIHPSMSSNVCFASSH
ncbi:F-box protein [Acorus gramineus]|uniref:F-box protein n=1 Tax=Acorus gramineus TaxID=55184 RepID=A0AAV9A594_ACOGR|nr:F-box protein [Acorus gramineus]